jgi:predicted secreted hydrolase
VNRRLFLKALPFLALPAAHAQKVSYPPVVPGHRLEFPRDHGAHPDFRIEWWYVTGWLEKRTGFQVTFFRARTEEQSDNPSAFAPRQILFAHAALSDPAHARLLHDERASRTGFGLAEVEEGRTHVFIDDWVLEQQGNLYRTRIRAREFSLELEFLSRQPPLLQGEAGFSRKGHRPHEASYYYSRPHLEVRGEVNGRAVQGSAWLDHEWSSAALAPEAQGWDWTGLNMANGEALMAFQIRAKAGGLYYASPGASFEVLRRWRSPRTGVEYPVSMAVKADGQALRLEPLMDDQELDSRASTGTIYWEGAVRAFQGNALAGKGYLELTGY